MNRSLYVYFQIDQADGAVLIERFAALRASIAAQSGAIECTLSRRCEPSDCDRRDGVQTWMETYRFIDAEIDLCATSRMIDERARACRLLTLARDGRHHEWFESCA